VTTALASSNAPKLISIVTPCFNEEGNVEALAARVREIFLGLPEYRYEHLFIDNASTDRTAELLRGIAAADPRVKVIVNVRNFGHVRSPYHAFMSARGDCVIPVVCDFQDPPELIPEFLEHWRAGAKLVMGVKVGSKESALMFHARKLYYRGLRRVADVELVENFYGFGLYDRQLVELMRDFDDPYPYVRGMVSEIGFKPVRVEYVQPARERGFTKNNLLTLYDTAMMGLTSHSKVPLRVATMLGFFLSFMSLLVGMGYLVAKLIFWDRFSLGVAPAVIGGFLFASVQLFFIGILGEYIGKIHTHVVKRPMVVERERINFDK
jgi:glycosyltransferase involved in cell wall biosynthesis